MKKLNLKRLKEVGEKATKGPWKKGISYFNHKTGRLGSTATNEWLFISCEDSIKIPNELDYLNIYNVKNENFKRDFEFIAVARNNWDQIIEEIEENRKLLKEARDILLEMKIKNRDKIYFSQNEKINIFLERFEDE